MVNRIYQNHVDMSGTSAFKNGRDMVEDLPRSGRPSTSSTEVNMAKMKEMVPF